jgi:hypothetical protein
MADRFGGGVATLWRIVFAAVGWFALITQFVLMVAGHAPAEAAARVVNYFSFFTIWTNLMMALALTLPVVADGTRAGRWAASESIRAMVTLYAVVVGLVYHFLLAPFWNPQGWLMFVNILLHYVMPAAFLADWILFTPKGRLMWIDPVRWLSVPTVYGVWTLIHGFISHWWPYGFLNVDALGLKAIATFTGLLIFFLIVGLAIVGLDRTLGRKNQPEVSI